MKSFKIIPKLPPVDINRIQEDEKKMKVNLPQSYKNFLLESNGGSPEPLYFFLKNVEDQFVGIYFFFGIAGDDVKLSEEDLYYNYIRTKDIYPKNFVPIAHTGGAPTVCIDTNSENFGKIFTFTTDAPPDEYTHRHGRAWKIADSFDEFIQGFQELPYDEYDDITDQLADMVAEDKLEKTKEILKTHQNSSHYQEYLSFVLDCGAYQNKPELVKYMMTIQDFDWDQRLFGIARMGAMDTLELFIEKGANVNAIWKSDETGQVLPEGFTPLMQAVERETPPMIKRLIELGADVNARSEEGSILWYAQETGNEEIIQLLKEAGAKE